MSQTTYRHGAYFSIETGRCLREQAGDYPRPIVADMAPAEIRLAMLDKWFAQIMDPSDGEVVLDVTHLGYPVGDCKWATFDAIDRTLSFSKTRDWLEGDVVTGLVQDAHSPRPIRSHGTRLILDVTGVVIAAYHGQPFEKMEKVDDAILFTPTNLSLPPVKVQLGSTLDKTDVEMTAIRALE
jgi:hypothetical protein